MADRRIAWLLAASLLSPGCWAGRHGGLGLGLFEAAVVTAIIVSSLEPPPPRVVYVPAPRAGYVWQAGYWTRENDQWVWIDGGWIEQRPQYQWVPTHWEQTGDGSWQLAQGHWVRG